LRVEGEETKKSEETRKPWVPEILAASAASASAQKSHRARFLFQKAFRCFELIVACGNFASACFACVRRLENAPPFGGAPTEPAFLLIGRID